MKIFIVYLILSGSLLLVPETPKINRKVSNEVSFENDIRPIIENSCATSNCHDGTMPPYLEKYNRVRAWSHRIKFRITYEKNPMPPKYSKKTLTQEQIKLITQWIDAGAKDN